MDPESLRAATPAFETCCYLNTGASGPSPRPVVEATESFQRRFEYEQPCSEDVYSTAEDALASARERVAGLLGTSSDHIALTQSTVAGINHVATAIDWDPEDVVVNTDLEHPAGELPWQRAADLHDVEVRTMPTERGRLDLDDVKTAVRDARLVCLSSVTWNYGTRLPVGEVVDIAHDAGAAVLVDAVQSPGQMPVDVEAWGADYVAASGHKWLLGPWGAGFLYVDEPQQVAPRQIGYFSVERPAGGGDDGAEDGEAGDGGTTDSSVNYSFRPTARRFELGTGAIAPYVGLETAIETMEAVGLDQIESRIARLAGRLKDGLGDRLLSPRDARSGLVTFAAENPVLLVERLAEEGIQIRWLREPHACRASVHALNTADDVDRLLTALESAQE